MTRRSVETALAVASGDRLLRFAAFPGAVDPDDDDVLLERLERRYEMGQQAGRDPQAGWLRRRIAELRARSSKKSTTERGG